MNGDSQSGSSTPSQRSSEGLLCALLGASGLAALSWETLWQQHASLALGISAQGTAITLATTMAGMSLGAYVMGVVLARRPRSPLRWYGVLEALIGASGLLLPAAFAWVKALDAHVYAVTPALAVPLYVAAIAAILGVPTVSMGATIPVFGLLSRQYGIPLSLLYGLNTIGAAVGTIAVALIGIPALGIAGIGRVVAAINFAVFGMTWLAGRVPPGRRVRAGSEMPEAPSAPVPTRYSPAFISLAIFTTGFATFALEVAWFRSLRAAFRSTTDAFAVMVAAVLIALGLAARLAEVLRRRGMKPIPMMATGGVLTILATPLIERFDMINFFGVPHVLLIWLAMSLVTLGPTMVCLGVVLPYFFDEVGRPGAWGRLYAVNTLGCVGGALVAAWILLPAFGFVHTAWGIGVLLSLVALAGLPAGGRLAALVSAALALAVAIPLQSGIGSARTQGRLALIPYKLLALSEGPDTTVSAIEYTDGNRALVIDGFQAASEMKLNHYMAWMGHLPMILQRNPARALVICFGTGQTANAVRREGAKNIDVVDLNSAVFQMGHFFPANEDVLDDPAVHAVVMDGRAYLRRTTAVYDAVTLEPMPPNFAGVNALYSREFYEDAAARMNERATIAQWLPFHLITPVTSASIARTFLEVFPGAVLWLDPVTPTGILIGRKGGDAIGSDGWTGLARAVPSRDLSPEQIVGAVVLSGQALRDYAALGRTITDDNQFLSYGREAMAAWHYRYALLRPNMELLAERSGRKMPMQR